jgi:hypothetical protein
LPRSKSANQTRPLPEPAIGPSGRVEMTFDELPTEARLRYEHAEKWVAWAPDQKSIIASGETYKEVREAARLAGHPEALMEWVLPVTGPITLTPNGKAPPSSHA